MGMINPTTGLYTLSARRVERVAGTPARPPQAEPGDPARPQDLMARDPVRVASVSDQASRSLSYQLAIRSLNDIDTYLSEFI